MSYQLRFAPSPTGYLHIGNIRVALINWMFAQQHQGHFLLRLDDTDKERSREDYKQAIMEDLAWLGLCYDQVLSQSSRGHLYAQAIERLKGDARLYPCYETPEELSFKRKRMLGRGQPPIYDRAALKLTMSEREAYEAEGRRPHWRFLLTPDPIQWNDMIHGPMRFDGQHLSDPVLIREDGRVLFTLSSVVDDIETGITHIFRGTDHTSNTAVQLQIFKALGCDATQIAFGHMPLVVGQEGEGLSKRLGSLSVRSLRDSDILPMAINSYLGTLGLSKPIAVFQNLTDLTHYFDPKDIGKASPKFSLDDLKKMNIKCLHNLTYQEVSELLRTQGRRPIEAGFWDVFKDNIESLDDLHYWSDVCFHDIRGHQDDPDLLQIALDTLPPGPWNQDTWSTWTKKVKDISGKKGRALFMPLRQALTGRSHGPEMKILLPYIGYEKTKQRLQKVLDEAV